jgi:hypothetical protein
MPTEKRIKKNLKLHLMMAVCFLVLYGSLPAFSAQESGFSCNVDPRLELLSVIQSLTQWPEIGAFTTFDFKYYREIKNYFGKYKNHPMVKWYDKNLKRNWGYNTAPEAMLHLSDPPNIKPLNPFPEHILKRGRGEKNLNLMIDLMNQFVKDTNFMKFWNDQQPFYKKFISRIVGQVPYEKYNRFIEDFYGETKSSFVFIPVPLFHRGGYGASRKTTDGETIFYIGGPHKVEYDFPVYNPKMIRWLTFHEFGHSFTRPVVNDFKDELNKYKGLFKYMKKSMKEIGYSDWITTCDEHFVRCGEYFLLKLAGFPEESQLNYQINLKQGFLLLPFIREKMEVFAKNRDKYPSFREFFPNFLEVFKKGKSLLKK